MSIVCCVTPAEKYLEETRSTLQFASRAKLVTTHATVNEVLDENAKIRRLQKEIATLREQQSNGNSTLNDESLRKIEEEKCALLSQLEALQQEREQQQSKLDRLKDLIVSHGKRSGNGMDISSDDFETIQYDDEFSREKENVMSKRRKNRETWLVN